MSSHGFLRGGKYPPLCIFEGAIILPCQLLEGQMSTHAIFHRGADVRGGKMSGSRIFNIRHKFAGNRSVSIKIPSL